MTDRATGRIPERREAVRISAEEDFVALLRVAELDLARDLRFFDWSGVDMSGCDLADCDFTGANLEDCRFDGARIAGARFDQAQVDRARLRQASDWLAHERHWTRSPIPGGDRHLPDLAVFSDAPFAPELVALPAGEFWMGSTEQEEGRFDGEGPRHRVTIGERFAIGRYPVIFDEYDRFCDARRRRKPGDRGWGRGRRPVINVSWRDAHAYLAWLTQETGRAYRLVSEAEWEYACRAGMTTRYSFGDAITPKDANYLESGIDRTSEVGAYSPNPWGIYDMHGNVWERVEDDWHESYWGAPDDGPAWMEERADLRLRRRVLRGGSWCFSTRLCRSAHREKYWESYESLGVGFRVAREFR